MLRHYQKKAVAVTTASSVRESPQSTGVLSVVNAIVSPTASAAAGRTEALNLANQTLLRFINLVQEWNINLSELGESALTLDAFFKQNSLQSGKLVAKGVTVDTVVDGDKGKDMVVDTCKRAQ